ncbi:MAG: glycosyltransferase family 2 protein [Siphonobacter sp.]
MAFFQPNSIQDFVSKPSFNETVLLNKNTAYPKISVITPSYNQAEFLERTILSVLNQNYPNLEFIIMDGGSTDHTVEIIKKYEKYIDYWVSEKDGGQTAAINAGYRKATGDWVTFQNSDDVFAPNAFHEVAKAIQQHQEVSVFYGHLLMIDEHDVIFEHKRQLPFWAPAQIYEGMQVFNQCMIFRRELLNQYGYFDEQYKFAFDYEICTRWAIHPEIKFYLVDDLWGCFRQHQLAKSSTIFAVGTQEHQKITNYYSEKIKTNLPRKIILKFIKIRKIVYFLLNGNLDYFFYRIRLRSK